MSKIANIVARAVVKTLDTAKKCQSAGLALIAGETKQNVEHIEPYGFTSAAHPGAEAVTLFPGGDRSHGVVIAIADRRYRLTGMQAGEVALYTDEGDSIVMRRGNIIEINTGQLVVNAKDRIMLNTPQIEASGNYTGDGNVTDKQGSMAEMRVIYNGHKHRGDSGGSTGEPVQKMD